MAELMMMWESMAAWFTPTVLFCLTNFIIATIFIASNKYYDHEEDSSTSLARVSSFIDGARSVTLSSYTTAESQHHYPPQPKTANYSSSSRLAQSIYLSSDYVVTRPELSESEEGLLSQPARVKSLFERVKSIKFLNEYNENVFPVQSNSPGQLTRPELPEYSEGGSPSQPARVPSLFERVKSIKFSNDYNENVFPVQSNSPGQLARAPSFFDRVKSFKFSSVLNSEPDYTNPEHHVNRIKSEKEPEKKSSVEMKKSRSEVKIAPDEDEDVDMRRPATARESRNDLDVEVDAKADDFISRFKQQLKLQRLESLVRYNEMLNRRR